MTHLLISPAIRYNIRQKKGIKGCGAWNGWWGDCVFTTFCCCFTRCQELRAVEVEEWDAR